MLSKRTRSIMSFGKEAGTAGAPRVAARSDHPDFARGALHAGVYVGLRFHLLPLVL